jgi:hypothetical protein
VERDVVAPGEKLVQWESLDYLRRSMPGAVSCAGGDHAQSQCRRTPGNLATDPPQADDPERLPRHAPQRRPGIAIVATQLGVMMKACHLPGQGQQQSYCVLSRLMYAVVWHIRDQNAAAAGGSDVDVIQPHADPRNNPAARRRLNHRGRDVGPTGHDRIGVTGQASQRCGIRRRRDNQLRVDGAKQDPLQVHVWPSVIGQQDAQSSS